MITYNQFLVMRCLIENGTLTQRQIAQKIKLSLGTVSQTVKSLREEGYVEKNKPTESGINVMKEYRVNNAIILAAGMATRFAPISYEFPKGLTVVNGEVLIERQIRQLKEKGVEQIVVVVGHMLEKFIYLKDKWNVEIVVNDDYKKRNTHSSVYAAREFLNSTYICCSDNYYPENLFNSYEYHSLYCAQFLSGESKTERGLITDRHGLIIATKKPCKDAWTMQGHAYFDLSFSKQFRTILEEYYNKPGVEGLYWEGIYAENLDTLQMYMVKCKDDDILEFDSVEDLRKFDPGFFIHNDLKVVKNICSVLKGEPQDIKNIYPVKGGLTNNAFKFDFKGRTYIYRNPGINTIGYIDREREHSAMLSARKLGIDNSYLYDDASSGWKLSYFVNTTEEFSFKNKKHLEKLCAYLRTLHQSKITCGKKFDFFEQADIMLGRLKTIDIVAAEDALEIRERIVPINHKIKKDNWQVTLSHNDIYAPNLLLSGEELYLIDWEYAGDSDIGNDLCKLFAAEDLPLDEIDDVLSVYYKRKPTSSEKRHILGCAAVNYYYWYIWSLYYMRTGLDCASWQMLWYKKMNKYAEEFCKLDKEEEKR